MRIHYPYAESGALETRRLSDGTRELLADLTIELAEDEAITVPRGFVTDYSSIPWIFRFIVRWSKVDIAGVVHDWLYYTGSRSQAEADRLWRLIARAGQHRANALQAWLGWLGLRIGGWCAWRRHRAERPAKGPETLA
jgi:hypothetical protein